MFQEMLAWERKLFKEGMLYVAGIDEVGKGPLAGPLVVAAAIVNLKRLFEIEHEVEEKTHKKHLYSQIRDSKKISDKKRRLIAPFLHKELISYSLIEVTHQEIDRRGISQAVQTAFFKSITGLRVKPEHVLTDFVHIKKITQSDQTNIPKGDSKSISIAAASIVAKVYRDNIMIRMHERYPEYGFQQHKGYGTKKHIAALHKHGPCEIHRRSFEPVKSLLH